MSVLVVGLSYRTAPVPVLERVSIPADEAAKVLLELADSESISEALLLSTCNRIEVVADVARFHPAVADVTSVLARRAGLQVSDLADYLYVHFAEAAVQHVFSVAAGLDSMVVGESQILGQLRTAYALGSETGTVGTVLHGIAQTALHVGKRVHSDTGIDQVGASVAGVALDRAEALLGPLTGRRAVVVGAGSMGALAAASLQRRGVTDIVFANRTPAAAHRLAEAYRGRAVGLGDIAEQVRDADLLVSSTGATGLVVEAQAVVGRAGRPLVVLDLALPRDVDPSVADEPGVHYVDLEALRAGAALVSDAELAAATDIVAEELSGHLVEQQQLAVAPTVTALRARAAAVIEAELLRLDRRMPGLDPTVRTEVGDAVRRAVEKVLHAPTVRVKELAATPGGGQYADALRELFGLDRSAPEAVSSVRAPVRPADTSEVRGTALRTEAFE